MTRDRANSQSIPLQQNGRDESYRSLFNEFDLNRDGYVSYRELWEQLRRDNHGLRQHVIRRIHERADRNDDGQLDYDEFVAMVTHPDNRVFFKHYFNRYMHALLPHQRYSSEKQDQTDGQYEDQYSCSPPAIGMIILSVIILILFFVETAKASDHFGSGPIAMALMYDPHRRREVWRFITYMFVHIGYFHLIVNLLVQIMLGVPLEMVHHWWRVLIIYFAGVFAGSLGTSITDPTVRLAGASGGVYSLITAHIATIVMNWNEMSYPVVQLLIFVVITTSDVGTAIYNRYVLDKDEHIGYAAHLCGAVAGLLVGITLLRNLEKHRTEKILQKVALIVYILLMGTAILWHFVFPSYFPVQTV